MNYDYKQRMGSERDQEKKMLDSWFVNVVLVEIKQKKQPLLRNLNFLIKNKLQSLNKICEIL